ncbi:MAG: hypothetical protein EOO06_03290 [Chitinophagaceae bacterium]|nr:MAG: hypothetical protein EOO06_03290 [Chitinophagaceae bacterium]
MTEQLSGKIYWVMDDFAYIGVHLPKKNMTSHAVANVEHAIVEEHLIKFTVVPFEYDGEMWSYNVNLVPNLDSTKFEGTFTEATESSHTGTVECELFNARNGCFLYGRWMEGGELYTFWVKLRMRKVSS